MIGTLCVLPLEIRTSIYRYVLCYNFKHPIYYWKHDMKLITDYCDDDKNNRSLKFSRVGLLSVSKLVNQECLPVLFKVNKFYIWSDKLSWNYCPGDIQPKRSLVEMVICLQFHFAGAIVKSSRQCSRSTFIWWSNGSSISGATKIPTRTVRLISINNVPWPLHFSSNMPVDTLAPFS